MPKFITPPSARKKLGELFALKDMLGVPWSLASASLKRATPPTPYPIIVLPGIGADDSSTWPLRYFLNRNGYSAEGWGLGRNLGGHGIIENLNELSSRWEVDRSREHNGEGDAPALCDLMIDQVEKRTSELGRPVILIGWSMGGYIAREVARELPDAVVGVITMGAPAFGGPKFSALAPLFKRRKIDLDWIEEEVEKRFSNPISQPIRSIYSKSDGIVAWEASVDDVSPDVKHFEVGGSHIGLGLNSAVWAIILQELQSSAFQKPFP